MGLAAGVLYLGCHSNTFACLEDAACGNGGSCEVTGFCSFPDSQCLSGRRYGEFAGDGLGGACVQEESSSSSGATTSPISTGSSTSTTSAPTTAGSTTLNPLTTGPEATGTTMSIAEDSTASDDGTDPSTSTGRNADESTSTGALPVARVDDGLTLLYSLADGDGDVILDQAPGEPAIDLSLEGPGYAWTATGLSFSGDDFTGAYSTGSTTKLDEACMASDAITIEAWLTPTVIDAAGPPRLLGYARSPAVRNFMVAVGNNLDGTEQGWKGRLRTASTDGNGQPDLATVDDPIAAETLTHFVFVHEASGDERLLVNGVTVASGVRTGPFAWVTDGTMVVALGNEVFGERPFQGEVHLAAVYCRALTDDEVTQNFVAGF